MRELLFQAFALGCEVFIAHSWILNCGEDKKATRLLLVHNSCWLIGHLILLRTSVHINNASPWIRIDAKEYLSLWRHDFEAAIVELLEFFAKQ